MSLDEMRSGLTPLSAEIDLLRRTNPIAALRSSLEWRFPGTGSIGKLVPLMRIDGYDLDAAREIVETATAGLGLRFTDQQIDMYRGCLADLADLFDTALARRLHQLYR
jgi:hypothetical protein